MEVVQNRSANTLHEIISRRVAPGSIVHTDLWRGYLGIENLDVVHRTVNHSLYYVDPISGVHTNTIEGWWNGLKLQIAPRNRTIKISNYLYECIWRRENRDNLWGALLYALKTTGYYEGDIENSEIRTAEYYDRYDNTEDLSIEFHVE